jgi:hypothetical protein
MKKHLSLCAGIVALLGSGVSARADYVFNFNSLGVSSGDNSAAVGTYMAGIFGAAVTVTGAATDQKYNGDGFVTGPGTGSITSLTLGTSDGATASNTNSTLNKSGNTVLYDTFLSNTAENSNGTAKSQISQEIDMTFAHAVTGVVSFDYQIFPDITGAPDFTFDAYNGATLVGTYHTNGVTPGTTDGTATRSPGDSTETDKQYIGVGTYDSVITFTKLEFHDWPATIGVDNLKIATTPEPTGVAFMLGGLMLALTAGNKLRKGLAKS